MPQASRAARAAVLQALPRRVYARVEENPSPDARAETPKQRPGLRERLPAARAIEAPTMRGLRSPRRDAPRGLLPPARCPLALPEAPSGAASHFPKEAVMPRKKKAPLGVTFEEVDALREVL